MQVDAQANCKNVSAHGGATQECLRTHRPVLNWGCQEQLFRQDVENADDLRLSTRLFRACLADKKKVCPFVWCSMSWWHQPVAAVEAGGFLRGCLEQQFRQDVECRQPPPVQAQDVCSSCLCGFLVCGLVAWCLRLLLAEL